MKKKLYLLALAVTLITLVAAVPAWATTVNNVPGTSSESNVTVTLGVTKTIGIDVPTATVAFTITAANIAAAPTTITPGSGSPVAVRYFTNQDGTAWYFKGKAGANFTDGTNTIPIGRLKNVGTGTGIVTFASTALTTSDVSYKTSSVHTGGWETVNIAYTYDVVGDEIAGGSNYSATLTYTMTTTP